MGDSAETVIGPDGRPFRTKPVVMVVIGMAGTGKSTVVQRLNIHSEENDMQSLYVNLDPACLDVNFGAAVDIRDTVSYRDVQQQYSLGPNGAIMTSLNLFATRIDEFVNVLESVAQGGDPDATLATADEAGADVEVEVHGLPAENGAAAAEDATRPPEYIIVDTPGQIEMFTWSASGGIILSALASVFPTVLVYVLDAVRCAEGPQVFGSNILYAASIAARTGLPFVVVVNKADAANAHVVAEWLKDPLAFSAHLGSLPDRESTYAHSMAQSMSLFVGKFLEVVPVVEFSAMEGTGIDALYEAVEVGRKQFLAEVVPRMNRDASKRRAEEDARTRGELQQVARDLGGDEEDGRDEEDEEEADVDVPPRRKLGLMQQMSVNARNTADQGTKPPRAATAERRPRERDGLNLLRYGGLATAAHDVSESDGGESDDDPTEEAAAQRLTDLLETLRSGRANEPQNGDDDRDGH